MYVSCDFLPRSCLLGYFLTSCDVLSMFILRVQRKRVETNMDPIFEHPVFEHSVFEHSVFDSVREKIKRFIKQLEKSQETFESLLYTLKTFESQF